MADSTKADEDGLTEQEKELDRLFLEMHKKYIDILKITSEIDILLDQSGAVAKSIPDRDDAIEIYASIEGMRGMHAAIAKLTSTITQAATETVRASDDPLYERQCMVMRINPQRGVAMQCDRPATTVLRNNSGDVVPVCEECAAKLAKNPLKERVNDA